MVVYLFIHTNPAGFHRSTDSKLILQQYLSLYNGIFQMLK